MLAEGTPAPDFTLPDHHGEQVTLSDHRGHWIAFWWFVEADTAG